MLKFDFRTFKCDRIPQCQSLVIDNQGLFYSDEPRDCNDLNTGILVTSILCQALGGLFAAVFLDVMIGICKCKTEIAIIIMPIVCIAASVPHNLLHHSQ